MNTTQNKDPFHGVTLEMILTRLLKKYGWEGLASGLRLIVLPMIRVLIPA